MAAASSHAQKQGEVSAAAPFPRETFTDVVVVGAGVSGLRAANEIQQVFQLQTVVLEARDIIGGRVRQDLTFVPGLELEMGAEFIHGDINQPTELAEELHWGRRQIFTWSHGDGGPSKRPAPDGGVGYYFLGKEGKLLRFDDEDAEFKTCNRALWELGEVDAVKADADKRNLREYLRDAGVGDRYLSLADAGYCNTQGGTLDSVPVARACKFERAWEGDGTDFDPDFRMSPSYSVLIKHLSKGLTIRTACPVVSISVNEAARNTGGARVDWDGAGPRPHAQLPPQHAVTVTCADGSIVHAHRVVVTVPLPILRAQEISFAPPLSPRKVAAAQSLSFANGVKIILKFRRRPWPADCHGAVCGDSFIPECWMNGTKPAGALIIGKANYADWYDEPLDAGEGSSDADGEDVANGAAGHSNGSSPVTRATAATLASDCGSTASAPATALVVHSSPSAASSATAVSLLPSAVDFTIPAEEPGVFFVCTGFTMGERADAIAALPQQEVINRFLEQLDRMFHMDASGAFMDGYVHSWAEEPYIRGAYATPTVKDDANAAKALAEPHLDTVFFAGEATAGATDAELRSSSVHFASPIVLHGAMETGSIAACSVARSLGLPVACVFPAEEGDGHGHRHQPLQHSAPSTTSSSRGGGDKLDISELVDRFLQQQRLGRSSSGARSSAAVPCITWRKQRQTQAAAVRASGSGSHPAALTKQGYATPIIPVSVSSRNLLAASPSQLSR